MADELLVPAGSTAPEADQKDPIQGTAAHDAQKRWLFLLPIVFITYSLAYLDRANYGFGAAAGLAKDAAYFRGRSRLCWGRCFSWDIFCFRCRVLLLQRRRSARMAGFCRAGSVGCSRR